VYKQIINYVCAALASGVFKAGDCLPTIRELPGCGLTEDELINYITERKNHA